MKSNPDSAPFIKKLSLTDVPGVIAAYDACSPELKEMMMGAWPLTALLGKIHLALSTTPLKFLLLFRIKGCVAWSNGEIAGMAYIINKWYKHEKILGVFICDKFQHKGIGTRLLSRILEGEDVVELNVREENLAAIRMYKKKGFLQKNTIHHMEYNAKK
jgi:ribosomal protein S18 acetylase RimI-like enzyme